MQQLVSKNAFSLIDYIEVEVGGQVIDKHYDDWMNIWCELTHTRDQRDMLTQMIDAGGNNAASGEGGMDLHLDFSFCSATTV